ncbi:MAG: alpha/beta hydrolase [Planctomycetota bacterium]
MHLVLLPGMDGTGRLFEPILGCFPPGLRTVVVAYPPDIARYDDLMPIVRAALPPDDPFVIVGESFSGPLAVRVAAGNPRGLRALVLIASFVRPPARWPFPALRAAVVGPSVAVVPWRVQARFLLGRNPDPQLLARVREVVGSVPSATMAGRIREVLREDVSGAVAGVRGPILYLRASRDAIVPRRCDFLIAELAPHARIEEIDGPHLLLQASPGLAAASITAFVRPLMQSQA